MQQRRWKVYRLEGMEDGVGRRRRRRGGAKQLSDKPELSLARRGVVDYLGESQSVISLLYNIA